MATPPPPAGWYADPQDGQRWRWWDGAEWTASTSGGADPSPDALWRDPLLYVRAKGDGGSRRASTVYDANGGALALLDPARGHIGVAGWTLPLVDTGGATLLSLSAGHAFGVLGALEIAVTDSAERPLGTMRPKGFTRRGFRLVLESGGQRVGEVTIENRRNLDFRATDASGTAIAITGRAEPSASKWLTLNDLYWISLRRPLPEALDRLTVAALVGHIEIQRLCTGRTR